MRPTDPYEPTPAECREFRKRVIQQSVAASAPDKNQEPTDPVSETIPKGTGSTAIADHRPVKSVDQPQAKQKESGWPTVVWTVLILAVILVFMLYRGGGNNEPSSQRDTPLSLIELPEPYHTNLFWIASGCVSLGLVILVFSFAWGTRVGDFHLCIPTRYAWDDQGIHQHTEHNHQLWHWDSIDRWYESDRLIAAGISSHLGVMLPKAALTPQECDELSAVLRSKLGEPRGGFADAD